MEVSTQTVYNFSQHSQIDTWPIVLLVAVISAVIYSALLYHRKISGDEELLKRKIEELDELNEGGGD